MQSEQIKENLLKIEDGYERASAGKRIANYLIDVVVFYLFAFVIVIVIAIVAPSSFDFLTIDHSGFALEERFISLVFYAFYMSIVEAVFKGKSLGKLITKTRAVNLDGSQISTSTAFARGFTRAIPFCAFSALGTPCDPWHDRWNNTMVVEDRSM
ncbi:MAG: RDD family protein [Chitinophagaceae bacterium]